MKAANEDAASSAQTMGDLSATQMDRFGTILGRTSVMGVVAMDRLAIAQNAVENAQLRAADAQMRYDDAVRKGGPGSEAAIRAKNELAIATRGVEIATQREEVRTLIMAGIVIPQMVAGVMKMIPLLEGWAVRNGIVTESTIALTTAQRALLATSIVGIPLLLAGLAFSGALGGGGGGSSSVNVYGDVNMPSATGPAGFGTSTSSWAQTVR